MGNPNIPNHNNPNANNRIHRTKTRHTQTRNHTNKQTKHRNTMPFKPNPTKKAQYPYYYQSKITYDKQFYCNQMQ